MSSVAPASTLSAELRAWAAWVPSLYAALSRDDWAVIACSGAALLAFFLTARGAVEGYCPGGARGGKGAARLAPEDARALRRSRAWTLSVLNSAVLGAAGVGYAAASLATPDARFAATFLRDHPGGGPWALAPSRALALWMMAFLVLDIAVGLVAYREHLELLSAYIHHAAYLVLIPWLLKRRLTALFAAGCAAELPTLMLALGSVHRPWRTDLAMGIVFGATRIALFVVLAARHHALTGAHASGGYALRNLHLVCIALHANWFLGWTRSYAKKRAADAAAARAAAAAGAPSPVASTAYTGSTPGGGAPGGGATPSSASPDAGGAHGAGGAVKKED